MTEAPSVTSGMVVVGGVVVVVVDVVDEVVVVDDVLVLTAAAVVVSGSRSDGRVWLPEPEHAARLRPTAATMMGSRESESGRRVRRRTITVTTA
jgi:hypothetical protein